MGDFPIVNFHFQVEWGGTKIGFTEVSGLDFETQVIEYRTGADVTYTTSKQPGLVKYTNIILKRGIFFGDNEFFDWWKSVRQEGYKRDMIISLLNENHEPTVVWKARSAWPSKIQSPTLKATGNQVAIETMEIVHEGLTIQNG